MDGKFFEMKSIILSGNYTFDDRNENTTNFLRKCFNQVTDTPGVPGDNRVKHASKSATSTRPDDVPKGKWMFYGDNKWITDPDLNVYSSYD